MDRDSLFSYRCKACGRCCRYKRIQTNPYEILRLSRNRGMSTGDFIGRFLEREGPYLKVREDGTCLFLEKGMCAVHDDRPLACRTYPLGRWVSNRGVETWRRLKPHPQSEGIYGTGGTVAQYLEEQGVIPYTDAADRYQALFYRLFDALQKELHHDADLAARAGSAMFADSDAGIPAFLEWLDVDDRIELYCLEKGRTVPDNVVDITVLHIMAVDEWLNKVTGGMGS